MRGWHTGGNHFITHMYHHSLSRLHHISRRAVSWLFHVPLVLFAQAFVLIPIVCIYRVLFRHVLLSLTLGG